MKLFQFKTHHGVKTVPLDLYNDLVREKAKVDMVLLKYGDIMFEFGRCMPIIESQPSRDEMVLRAHKRGCKLVKELLSNIEDDEWLLYGPSEWAMKYCRRMIKLIWGDFEMVSDVVL